MAVIDLAATEWKPEQIWEITLPPQNLYIMGEALRRDPWSSEQFSYGRIWHIVRGDTQPYTSHPSSLCSNAWRTHPASPHTHLAPGDRVCKVCMKMAAKRARDRGLH